MRNVIFQVTNLCNASCKHCFLRQALNKNTEHELSLSEVKRFLTSLGKVNNMVIGGGEPLLRADLEQLCLVCIRAAQLDSMTLATNGSCVGKTFQFAKTILERTLINLEISLSVDGPAAFHDTSRGVEGLYQKVVLSYQRLSRLYYLFFPRLSLQVNTAVSCDNSALMPEIYRLVTKEFPLAHFSFEVIRGAYDHALVRAVSVDEYRALIETLTDLCRADDAVFHRHLDLHRSALATMQQKTQIVPCVAGKDFIVLDACGNIYPCEMLPAFANVRAIDYNFANVVGDPRWQQTLATIAAKQCHCPHLCFLFASLEAMRGTL